MSAETAWQALFVHAALLPVKGTGARGKRVFVTGASGAAGMVRRTALSAEVPLLLFFRTLQLSRNCIMNDWLIEVSVGGSACKMGWGGSGRHCRQRET